MNGTLNWQVYTPSLLHTVQLSKVIIHYWFSRAHSLNLTNLNIQLDLWFLILPIGWYTTHLNPFEKGPWVNSIAFAFLIILISLIYPITANECISEGIQTTGMIMLSIDGAHRQCQWWQMTLIQHKFWLHGVETITAPTTFHCYSPLLAPTCNGTSFSPWDHPERS